MDKTMKLLFRALLVCCVALGNCMPAIAAVNKSETIEWATAITYRLTAESGLEGAFKGYWDGYVIVAGGIDSTGCVTDKVVVMCDNGRLATAELPHAIYGGTSVVTAGGLLCVGGRNGESCYADVILVKVTDGAPVVETMPSLPVALTGAAVVVDGYRVWVAGGCTNPLSLDYSDTLYLLDLQSPQKGWKEVGKYTGIAREGAVAAIQNNGVTSCLYIFGGRDACGTVTEGCSYNIQLGRWNKIDCEFPEGVVAVLPIAANHIFAVQNSGVGTASLWQFHTVTHTMIKKTELDTDAPVVGMMGNEHGFTLLATALAGSELLLLNGEIHPVDEGLGIINILVIIAYFAVLAGIGIYFSRRQKNTDDYFKGGGRIPWWAAGLSLFGTALSAITFMAIPAKAYATDWSYALFNMGILLVASVIVWVFIPYFRNLNITTAYQYLELRFNAAIRVICSLAFIVYQVGRMGVVLFLPAIALNVVTGVDIFMCIGIMGICSILYTMIGGIEAVVWTDAIQVIILLGGALFAVIYIACAVPGGITETVRIAASNGKFALGSMAFDLKDSTMWTVLIATCFTNLTTYGTDQSMVQRYLTTPSLKAAKKSVWTNALLTIPATVLFFFIGTALYSYYTVYPENLSVTIPNGDAIFPWYIFTELPVGVVGVLISGIFAAAMSTLSGSMNSAATAYIVDIYPRLCARRTPGLHAARVATLVIGTISLLFAFLMATWNIASLWDEFNKILGLILGSMGGLFMLGMLTKRANSGGAIVGIIVSMAVQLFVARFQTFHLLLYTTSGFVSCFVAGYVASFLFPSKKNDD